MEPTEPTATAATKTPAVPVPAGMVPLSHLSEGLVTRTFAELTNLAETLPGMTSADAKKGALIRFCIHWRQQWIKLLVLVRWAKRVGDLGSLMTALAFLESQDALFAGAADALVRTHSDMLLIREPNYDIITAVDILSLGNFHRLPTIIRKSTIPPAPLSKSQIENTLVRLQDTIRMRLLADDVVPFPFRKCMSIARGCVTFTVQHKFQVTLSLDGTIPRMPWKIVDLQILVQFVKEDYEGVIGIHDYQLNGIIASAAQSLLPPPLPEQSSSIPNSGIDLISQATTVHHPLVELHDHLDHFCAHLQMEILKTQVMHLARTRWNTHLGFEYTPTPEGTFMLKIRYWCASGALPSDGKVLRHYVLIHLETQWATGAKAAAGFLPATADEADKNSHAIITASNSASGAKATFTQRTLTVRAFSQLHPSGGDCFFWMLSWIWGISIRRLTPK
ncbi:mediator complex subunit MED14-domain-containing protein [Chytriomyces sp. MP71]|nr:mediator complex subunit MED14-domain-containing protein [Chytriomyces sp. MP71]